MGTKCTDKRNPFKEQNHFNELSTKVMLIFD